MLRPIDKQIVKSWYQQLVEPHIARLRRRTLRTTGQKIAVVGICQSYSIAFAMKLLLPAARVDHFAVTTGARSSIEILAETLATYDIIFAHDFPGGFIPGGGFAKLRELVPRIFPMPVIVFAAFHPDSVYVGDIGSPSMVLTPLGPYHSALAVFAFRAGLSIKEANALFNDNVFEVLGYYNLWNDACRELIQNNKDNFGYDISTQVMSWARRGVFMYTINHPKPFVMADVAKLLLSRVGLQVPEIDEEFYMIDDLMQQNNPIFPVYPPIGALYGVKGSYTFRITATHPVRGLADYLTLPQFISSCYKKYQDCIPTRLHNPRVDAWLADSRTCNLITSLARKNLAAGLTPEREQGRSVLIRRGISSFDH